MDCKSVDGGSSPPSTFFILNFRGYSSVVEQLLCKQKVAGSILASSIVIFNNFDIQMKYRLVKDRRRRILFALFERRRRVLRALVENLNLSPRFRAAAYRALLLLPRDSSPTRFRNRCTLTGRPRAVYRRFGLSRIRFRKLA